MQMTWDVIIFKQPISVSILLPFIWAVIMDGTEEKHVLNEVSGVDVVGEQTKHFADLFSVNLSVCW